MIGGGMAGVLCARLLTDAGVNCALVEAREIGGGTTKGTTAVLTAQHDTLYSDLIDQFGTEKAAQYLHANLCAVERLRKLARGILCEWENQPSVMYVQRDPRALEREMDALHTLGFQAARWQTEIPLPIPVAGAICYPEMAQLHPLQFLYGAAEGLRIYEHSLVNCLKGHTAYTEHGAITAEHIVVATHFPFVNRHGLYFMKLYQNRSFVLALENAPTLHCTLVDAGEAGLYFRNAHGLLLVGGGDRRTGCKGADFEGLRAFTRKTLPGTKELFAWAAQDCMSLDGVPYIGAYSPKLPYVYVATGFNEWGMTTSMVAAEVLTARILGKENPDAAVFAPKRSMLSKQLFANAGETMLRFCVPTLRRCPHLGCALKWDAQEHSWECPCHGSRFEEQGALTDGPALHEARTVKKKRA
ncbi:MAG: FAD-dependent oxidoreductase [Clostridia bacterium]